MSESLRQLLERVHQRLSREKSVDDESRELLATVMSDIDRTLKSGAAKGKAEHAPRLESLAVQFEADHPDLAKVLRQLIDTLQKAGI